MAIKITDNFQVNIKNPIDNRFVVGSQSIPGGPGSIYPTPFYAYRDDISSSIGFVYPGLRIWDFNENLPYVWTGTTWSNENLTGASVEGSGNPAGTGFQNYVTKFKNNATVLTKSLLFDDYIHVSLGTVIGGVNPNGSAGSAASLPEGLHVQGRIRTNKGFVGIGEYLTNLDAGKIDGGPLGSGRLQLQWINTAGLVSAAGTNPYNPYLLTTDGSNLSTSWQSLLSIVPHWQPNTLGLNNSGAVSLYSGENANGNFYEFFSLVSSGLQIDAAVNGSVRVETKPAVSVGAGAGDLYAGLNAGKQHQIRTITSGSLDVTTVGNEVKVELHVDINDKAFYVNSGYNGPEMGTLAKPFKDIESALYAFVGKGTRWNPEWRGRGKIILLGYVAPTFDMVSFWNYKDSTNVYINRISTTGNPITSPSTPTLNTQINTTGWLSVNNIIIDGQGFGLEYQGSTPYWISTEKFVNSYQSNPSESINNTFSVAQYGGVLNQPLKDLSTNRLTIGIGMDFINVRLISRVHEAIYHLNYGYDVYVPQPGTFMSLKGCDIIDNGWVRDRDTNFTGVSLTPTQVDAGLGKYIKLTNRYNGVETHFGNEIWVENRIDPTTGLPTGNSIPTDQYLIRLEGRNWNNEGYFEMSDCNLTGSSSTIIYIKNTSVGFTNIKMNRQSDYNVYGEDGPCTDTKLNYHNHVVNISYHNGTGESTDPTYSPYSISPFLVNNGLRAKAWVNKFLPKKNLYYVITEGDQLTHNGGISNNVWCRIVNLNIENSLPTTPYRNNQVGHTFQNSGLDPQNWVSDADPAFVTPANSQQINYNRRGYFRTQLGGSDALFKIDGNSTFTVDGGYVYGEEVNNIIHKSLYAGISFVDCNFDNLTCVDIPGQEWTTSQSLQKRGAFKLLSTSLGSGGIYKGVGLLSSKINFVLFKSGAPYTTDFFTGFQNGTGWNTDFIFPQSSESTVNKVSFSTTIPLVGTPAINDTTNNNALNQNVGYNAYKLIPGNKYYNTTGNLTVVKVPPSPGATITYPVEFDGISW